MHDYNMAQLAGNITKDPALKYVAVPGEERQVPVVELTLAVDGEGSKETGFFTVVAWRGLALAIAKHKRKGDPILVEGPLDNRSWKAGDGSKRSRLVVKARSVRFLARGRGPSRTPETRRHDAPQRAGRPRRPETAPAEARRKEAARAR